jgi:8-oxo-dGTP pyrophosphatase MutT (NUDIX family)
MTAGNASDAAKCAIPDRRQRPRDAATLILVDQSTGEPRILMGRRRADQVFLPGKFVFPGGRVDRADGRAPSADELRASEAAKLMLDLRAEASLSRPRALALAAVRETFEETGLLVGTRLASRRLPQEGPWRDFLGHGVVPRLSSLTFLARAITPPGRPRRYDTRFFLAEASGIAHRVAMTDGELESLEWFTIEEMRGLELPTITRVVVEDLADRLKLGIPGSADVPVPFYFQRHGLHERVLLRQAGETAAMAPSANWD